MIPNKDKYFRRNHDATKKFPLNNSKLLKINVKKTETDLWSVRKMPDHEIVFFEFLDVATDMSFYIQAFPWKLFFSLFRYYCVYLLDFISLKLML